MSNSWKQNARSKDSACKHSHSSNKFQQSTFIVSYSCAESLQHQDDVWVDVKEIISTELVGIFQATVVLIRNLIPNTSYWILDQFTGKNVALVSKDSFSSSIIVIYNLISYKISKRTNHCGKRRQVIKFPPKFPLWLVLIIFLSGDIADVTYEFSFTVKTEEVYFFRI